LNVPIYLLGSSDFSARLAAELGLPFAFASHFAPDYLHEALELYRMNFRPSPQLAKPHAMVGVNVFAADTDEEGQRLFTTLQQAFLGIIRGARAELPPPVESMRGRWNPAEEAHVRRMLSYSAVGSRETVRRTLAAFIEQTGADEIVATAQIYDHAARLRSFEIAAEVFQEMSGKMQ
jgi:luciferase family oxidoreductase group 1